MRLSPDGRRAIVDGTPAVMPERWMQYENKYLHRFMEEQRVAGWGAPGGRLIRQLFLVDIDGATSRPLWDAPSTVASVSLAWSADNNWLLFGPTHTPIDTPSEAGMQGKALVAMDLRSGQWTIVTSLRDQFGGDMRVSWLSSDLVECRIADQASYFKRSNGGWKQVERKAEAAKPRNAAGIRVEVREDYQTPPTIVAVDERTGREQIVRDLNPQLQRYALGRVEPVTIDADGRQWSALLNYPVGYQPAKRYPLVIQTHGHAPVTQFSLYGHSGPGLGPGATVYAAQAMANRGLMVLTIQDMRTDFTATPAEPVMYMRAYEAMVADLNKRGLIDTAKVGIIGFSRTGWHVQYALTHSDFPYAAALISDPTELSYAWTSAFSLWAGEYQEDVGAAAFGEGLGRWLENSPGFNADRIRTPVRFVQQGPGTEALLMNWETFSRMRFKKIPTELYVIPDISNGSHAIQNPRQLLAIGEGTVDWFDFWLNGHEDGEASKAQQYAKWEELRGQYEMIKKEPRPSLLKWRAESLN